MKAQPSAGRVLLCSTAKAGGVIQSATWNSATGEIGTLHESAKIVSPAFMAFDRTGGEDRVYVVSEANGSKAIVSAFAADPTTGALQLINTQSSGGDGPTHVATSPDGRMLALANYSGGSITTYRIDSRGALSTPVSHIQYMGHGPNPDRQESAHAHSARFTSDSRFLLVNNFGLDQILIYRVDPLTAVLTPHSTPVWAAKPGSGPRHIAFHPNGRWIYCLNELDSTVEILQWDSKAGTVTSAGRVSSLPKNFPPGKAFSGEIQVSPDGRNLYIGNRVASDTMAVFRIEKAGGGLTLIQLANNGGRNTRHFAIDPTGRWLILCEIASNTVVILERSASTGRLSEPVHTYPLESPMFVGFLPN
ncbi:lactonase family protein [Terriglobus roseus]|uniref:6-phosphogluconolactonase, cycloisomerase 2 family n=1 Tax=Terriglobus roseus TaxID=392734 RepID=A0A1H4IXV1_9BACT|nr:lactonase family protein [Terriglobus roseus]SEB38930.1 6-phosphogluconolactonase, cycloisomerase 2 family [Terriglobus roseus]